MRSAGKTDAFDWNATHWRNSIASDTREKASIITDMRKTRGSGTVWPKADGFVEKVCTRSVLFHSRRADSSLTPMQTAVPTASTGWAHPGTPRARRLRDDALARAAVRA
jgi:hypothetical protein